MMMILLDQCCVVQYWLSCRFVSFFILITMGSILEHNNCYALLSVPLHSIGYRTYFKVSDAESLSQLTSFLLSSFPSDLACGV